MMQRATSLYGLSMDQPMDTGHAMSRSFSAHPMLYSGSEAPWASGFSPNLGVRLDLPAADELLEQPEPARDSFDAGFAFVNPSASNAWAMPPTPDLADGSSYYSSAMSRSASMVSSYLPGPAGTGWALGADTDFLRPDKTQFNYMGSVFDNPLLSPDEGHSQFSTFSFAHADPEHRTAFGSVDMARSMSSSTTYSHDPLSSLSAGPSPTDESPRRPSSSSTTGPPIGSSSSKMEIPRFPRPTIPAHGSGKRSILCDKCDTHPEGFRGDHELMRHKRLFHSLKTNKWVCVDLHATDGVETGSDWYRPKLALDECQNCRNGKQYGQYYNAAAHLRRYHFHPKPRGRPKGDARPRRAGSAGGSEPSIAMLKKYWLRCIEVRNDNFAADAADEAVDDEAQRDEDEDEELYDEAPLLQRPVKGQLQRHRQSISRWEAGPGEGEERGYGGAAETVATGWRPRTIGRMGPEHYISPVY